MIRRTILPIAVLFATFVICNAQQKTVITKAEDLPKHTYELENRNASELVRNREAILEISAMVKKDLLDDLANYEIQDRPTLKSYNTQLRIIETIEGNYGKALQYLENERVYSDKRSERLVRGMDAKALLGAMMEENTMDPEILNPIIEKDLKAQMMVDDFTEIQELVEEFKGSQEIISENLLMGQVESWLQKSIDNNEGDIPGDLVFSLISIHYALNYSLPYKDAFFTSSSEMLGKYGVYEDLVDIWESRVYHLGMNEAYEAVILGIWDTGSDMEVFPEENRWINPGEKYDGSDSDENGFVDDVHGIAYNMEMEKTSSPLLEDIKALSDVNIYKQHMKGLQDLLANIDSKEASALKRFLAGLQPAEVEPFIENLSMYGIYAHGTHVAGIAVEGNPYAKILAARFTADYRSVPKPYTEEYVKNWDKFQRETVQYFKDQRVRVVNMSWGIGYEEIESNLAVNGIGKDGEERKTLAMKYFRTMVESFKEAIESAPEILFVASAGNSNDDVDFSGTYPSSLNYPNLLTVGAVDIAGRKAGFTTEGASVDVFANGFEVESYVPGGDRIPLSGTSMSSPQVVNLAGKILTIQPDLSPEEVKEVIISTSTPSEEDENVLLIHPKRAMESVM